MASGNPYFTGVNQTLEEYIPMPMDMLLKAGQAVQGRYDQAIADDSAMETGLASIQAKAPAYKEYVNNMLKSYKGEMSSLIDKYGGKLENPEFVREQKKVINRYKNDPTWSTITDGNKAIERAQEIEAKMRAEGKLFISGLSNFSGKDANGNLTTFNGSPESVNTLEEWDKSFGIAHRSTEDIGNKTTNRRNLDRTRQAIEADIKNGGVQSTKLMQAYMGQGMTPEQAKQAVLGNVSTLVNQYGVEEKINMGLLSYGLQRDEFNYRKQRDAAQDKLARDLAAAKLAAKKSGSGGEGVLTPSFDEFKGRMGSVATITRGEGDDKVEQFVFGSGKSSMGISSRDIKGETVSGEIYDLSNGGAKSSNKSINIAEGKEVGTRNVWVREDNGELIVSSSKQGVPKVKYINGKAHIEVKRNNKLVNVPVEERTVKEYTYNKNAGQKGANAKDAEYGSFFKVATPEEAVDQMGYSNAAWKGMGQTKARGVYNPSSKKLDVDLRFVGQNFGHEAEKYFKSIEAKHNAGQKLTPQEVEDLQNLEAYDTRKALWDSKVLPKYQNQGKAKNLLNTEIDE